MDTLGKVRENYPQHLLQVEVFPHGARMVLVGEINSIVADKSANPCQLILEKRVI